MPQADPAYADMNAALADPTSLLYRATFGATSVRFEDANDPWAICAPDPSGGGHGSALGLARLYAALITGLDGRPPILSAELMEQARRPVSEGMDEVLRLPTRWGLGFMLPRQPMWTEVPARGFGHAGASGSIGFADPERGLCVGYTPSAWTGLSTGTDERAETLIRTLYAGLTD